VSSCCRKDNSDTNISTAFPISAMIILSTLCDFTIIQLLRIVINVVDCTKHVLQKVGVFCFEALLRNEFTFLFGDGVSPEKKMTGNCIIARSA
jgi:hypothetical protein